MSTILFVSGMESSRFPETLYLIQTINTIFQQSDRIKNSVKTKASNSKCYSKFQLNNIQNCYNKKEKQDMAKA